MVHGEHICAVVDESLGRIALDTWIKPGGGPDDLDNSVRVSLGDTEGEGVNAANDLRDRHRSDIANTVRLGLGARGHACDEARLIDAAERVAEVGLVSTEARDVLEADIRVVLGELGLSLIHI